MEAWAREPAPSRTVVVDRKDIQRFAVATGAKDPVHFDPVEARNQGYRDIIAPPLFYVSLRTSIFNLVHQDELHEEGTPLDGLPPIEFSQAMAGETRAELHMPFQAGDEVTCTRSVHDMYEKQGRSGPLVFVVFEYRYADIQEEPFVLEYFTRIFR